MQEKYQKVNNLTVSKNLLDFIDNELLKDIDIDPKKFWAGFDHAVHELAPRNKELIKIINENIENLKKLKCNEELLNLKMTSSIKSNLN